MFAAKLWHWIWHTLISSLLFSSTEDLWDLREKRNSPQGSLIIKSMMVYTISIISRSGIWLSITTKSLISNQLSPTSLIKLWWHVTTPCSSLLPPLMISTISSISKLPSIFLVPLKSKKWYGNLLLVSGLSGIVMGLFHQVLVDLVVFLETPKGTFSLLWQNL